MILVCRSVPWPGRCPWLGERWTLLILRDAFFGTRRFDEFQSNLGITRHRLSERLNKLVEHGVLTRVQYSDRNRCGTNTG
jgi:DNA-binding HxlR family transcriptional regulator